MCPLCNGEFTYKNGLHGKFYGCSNYPKCHFSIYDID
ncbi:topoisomerase DNA-binding C4 zinc finger domain-containing protein [Metamycoplasma hominis]